MCFFATICFPSCRSWLAGTRTWILFITCLMSEVVLGCTIAKTILYWETWWKEIGSYWWCRSAAIYRLVDNKSKATPGQATLEKKSVGNVTSKPGSFKVRLRPTETPLAAPRVEPIKLRLPGRPNLPRDNPDHAESGSSGGKQDVEEQKVGKLKLKIKTSSSSAQEGAG